MQLKMILAMDLDGCIGKANGLPWRLRSDMLRFKRLTMGHHLIMGRNTYESIGRLLPGRTTIIMTRNANYSVEGALIAGDLPQALAVAKAAGDDEVFVVGGGQVYQHALPHAQRIYATRIHTQLSGDTFFPEVDWGRWQLTESTTHPADSKNDYAYSFEDYQRKVQNDA